MDILSLPEEDFKIAVENKICPKNTEEDSEIEAILQEIREKDKKAEGLLLISKDFLIQLTFFFSEIDFVSLVKKSKSLNLDKEESVKSIIQEKQSLIENIQKYVIK